MKMVFFTSLSPGLSIPGLLGEGELSLPGTSEPVDPIEESLPQVHQGASLGCTKEPGEGLGTSWEPHLSDW
jgi:hypothetical protein